jgi:hypothetical protein
MTRPSPRPTKNPLSTRIKLPDATPATFVRTEPRRTSGAMIFRGWIESRGSPLDSPQYKPFVVGPPKREHQVLVRPPTRVGETHQRSSPARTPPLQSAVILSQVDRGCDQRSRRTCCCFSHQAAKFPSRDHCLPSRRIVINITFLTLLLWEDQHQQPIRETGWWKRPDSQIGRRCESSSVSTDPLLFFLRTSRLYSAPHSPSASIARLHAIGV